MSRYVAFFAFVFVVGCGGDLPSVDCSSPVPKYSELTILPHCTNCHSSMLEARLRSGAPLDINLDTYEAAKSEAEESVEEVYERKMPYPDGMGVTEEQRTQFYRWGLCGTPN